MQRTWRWVAVVAAIGVLAACGQPGDFVLPEQEGTVQTAGTVRQVFPLEPIVFDEPGEMVNETPTAWFIEFVSAPSVEGGRAATMANERAAFRRDAAAVGAAFEQRRDFQTLFNGISVNAKPSAIARIAQLPGVIAVWPVERVAIPETQPSVAPDLFTALAMTGADVVQSELGFTGVGIKVAVMDSGIDYNHPDLGGAWGNRVAYGWDFVGNDFNGSNEPVPGPDPDDCNGHGTHVAGIIGASGVVTGVAPGVTFGAYKVFGCTGSTWADIMIEAMEMALADGMDVLNMSIGSAFSWPQYPTAVAADRLVKRGMVVVASIGNSGASGLYSAGAPGLGKDVIGVASFDNTDVYVPYFEVGDSKIGYIPMTYSPPAPTSGTEEIVYIGQACNTDPLLDDPAGKVALAVRGVCAFSEKALNAIDAGAVAVVIHNNVPGIVSGTLGAPLGNDIPVVGISLADGLFIRGQAAPTEMTWTDEMVLAFNPTGGLISSFSSYGLAADLALKPDIGAPGGSIYSTYPLKDGGYAVLSGTSMSSPHVAGAVALLLEAMPRTRAEDVRGILQNSAVPKPWSGNPGLGFLDNVHRQGAGMLQIDDAILATTRITPAKLELGESAARQAALNLKIDNLGDRTVTYTLSYVNALSTGGVRAPGIFTSSAQVHFNRNTVTVRPGASANARVTIDPATGPAYGQYGGYIVATPDDGGPAVRVPYAGFVGDYQSIQVLTPSVFGFPVLGWTPDGENFGFAGEGDVFTLEGYDVPLVLVHLEHQSRYMEMNVIDATTGAYVHPVFHKAYTLDYLSRNSTATGFFALDWDGTRFHSQAAGGRGVATPKVIAMPDGEYMLEIRLLKALGDKNDASHWETWTSPMFVIDRP
jgi:minor extracellular serine protease Vpr